MKRLACIGECMIELWDAGGADGAGRGAMHRSFGGDSLNSAVYAARCRSGEDAALSAALAAFDLVYVSGITLAIMREAGPERLFETLARTAARRRHRERRLKAQRAHQ